MFQERGPVERLPETHTGTPAGDLTAQRHSERERRIPVFIFPPLKFPFMIGLPYDSPRLPNNQPRALVDRLSQSTLRSSRAAGIA